MKVYLDVEKEGDSDLYNDAMGVVEAQLQSWTKGPWDSTAIFIFF